jgi:hypothetical protein
MSLIFFDVLLDEMNNQEIFLFFIINFLLGYIHYGGICSDNSD